MPRFLVHPAAPSPASNGREHAPAAPPPLYIDADQEASVVLFMISRGIPYHHLEAVDEQLPLPRGARHQRVPDPVPPSSPARRRLKLAATGVGLGLFIIAGYFFVMKAKEHLTRAPANQPPPSWQR